MALSANFSARSWALALACASASAGCRALVNADDWQVADRPPTSEDSLCQPCGADRAAAALRHVPCRPSAEFDGDDGQLHFHVLQTLSFGLATSSLAPSEQRMAATPAGLLGLDMDCSERLPDGLPAACRPRPEAQLLPWSPAPMGIDNALGQRLFGGLKQLAGNDLDLERSFSAGIAEGRGTITMSLYHWNGTPNDAHVGFTTAASPGISSGTPPPQWMGEDQWDVLASGEHPDFPGLGVPGVRFTTDQAYVRDGVLVADLRNVGELPVTLFNRGARLELVLHDYVFTARIDGNVLEDAAATGRLQVEDLLGKTFEVARFLAGCNEGVAAQLRPILPGIFSAAADLPVTGASGYSTCSAISVAYGGRAPRAVIGKFVPTAGAQSECP